MLSVAHASSSNICCEHYLQGAKVHIGICNNTCHYRTRANSLCCLHQFFEVLWFMCTHYNFHNLLATVWGTIIMPDYTATQYACLVQTGYNIYQQNNNYYTLNFMMEPLSKRKNCLRDFHWDNLKSDDKLQAFCRPTFVFTSRGPTALEK